MAVAAVNVFAVGVKKAGDKAVVEVREDRVLVLEAVEDGVFEAVGGQRAPDGEDRY